MSVRLLDFAKFAFRGQETIARRHGPGPLEGLNTDADEADSEDGHVARMSRDLAPSRGSRRNEPGSMESKSSRIDAGSAISMLIHSSG
jgi:hypothetical protein